MPGSQSCRPGKWRKYRSKTIAEREREKGVKYQELAADLVRNLIGFKVRVVPKLCMFSLMSKKFLKLVCSGRPRGHLGESQLFPETDATRRIKELNREVMCCST